MLTFVGVSTPALAQQDEPPTPVASEPTDAPPAESETSTKARTLFDEGLALYEAGDYVPACARLTESNNTRAEVRTLGLLAACLDKRGLLASAWRTYIETALLAAQRADDLEAVARERAFGLEERVPRLLIKLPLLEGLVVRLDNNVLSAAELQSALHLDPGTAELVVTANGRQEFRAVVRLEESVETVVEVSLRPVEPKTIPPPPKPEERDKVSPLVPIGIVAGSLGLAALGIGIGFGVAAKDANDESILIRDSCAGSVCDRGRLLREDAQSYATISTASFIGGLVAVAGGTVMFAVGLSTTDEAPGATRVSLGIGSAQLEGSW